VSLFQSDEELIMAFRAHEERAESLRAAAAVCPVDPRTRRALVAPGVFLAGCSIALLGKEGVLRHLRRMLLRCSSNRSFLHGLASAHRLLLDPYLCCESLLTPFLGTCWKRACKEVTFYLVIRTCICHI
jgi:hypothetical protein